MHIMTRAHNWFALVLARFALQQRLVWSVRAGHLGGTTFLAALAVVPDWGAHGTGELHRIRTSQATGQAFSISNTGEASCSFCHS